MIPTLPCRVNFEGDFLLPFQLCHFHDVGIQQLPQVILAVKPEAVCHDFAGEGVASEQSLHAVRDLHLPIKILYPL
jgi:hypothetical protein